MTIFWAVPHTVPIVWMVVESNHFCYFILVHSTVSTQLSLHLWGHSEEFLTSTTSSLFFTTPSTLVPALFLVFSLPLFIFRPLIILVGWTVHVNSIKFTFHIVLGAPTPILSISSNIFLWFLDKPGLKIVKSLDINLVGVPSFFVVSGLGSCTSSSLDCCKDRSFFCLT